MIKLSPDEQAHVRVALRYLRRRGGVWKGLAPALGFRKKTLTNVAEGRQVSPAVAFSVARLAGLSIDDLLSGKWPPPGTCPHCGGSAARRSI